MCNHRYSHGPFTQTFLALFLLMCIASPGSPADASQRRPISTSLTAQAGAPGKPPSSRKADLNALTAETQQHGSEEDDMTFVWWIPDEFWDASLKGSKELTAAEVEEYVGLLSAYTIVVVVEGRLHDLKAVYRPEAEIRAALSVRDKAGDAYAPLPPDRIGVTAKGLVDALRPMFADMVGPLGKNMHVFFFPGKNKAGSRHASGRDQGSFAVLLRGREFRWRLPLASLLPPKSCPTCKEKLIGSYRFCPYDGVRLP